MRRMALALVLALTALPAKAQSVALPELFSVTGVAMEDRLNIRQNPDAKSPILGRLAPDAKNIEVLAQSGAWSLINAGEGSGWVATRFLRADASAWTAGALPATLSCHGTEPFWSLSFPQGQALLKTPDAADQTFPVTAIHDRGFAQDRLRAIEAGDLSVVIMPQDCSDGMSERSFALQVVALIKGGTRPMLSGCCTIAP